MRTHRMGVCVDAQAGGVQTHRLVGCGRTGWGLGVQMHRLGWCGRTGWGGCSCTGWWGAAAQVGALWMHKLEGGVHAHRLEHQMREWEGSPGEEGQGLDTDGTLRRCPEGAERRGRRGGN